VPEIPSALLKFLLERKVMINIRLVKNANKVSACAVCGLNAVFSSMLPLADEYPVSLCSACG
jgi:hypothetical protein